MAKNTTNWTAWVLKFVGSLAYLWVVWGLWTNGVNAGTFGTVLFGLAVVMSVGFFITTLVALTAPSSEKMRNWSSKSAFVAGFALASLLAPVAGPAAGGLWVVLVGFILAYVGNGMEKM